MKESFVLGPSLRVQSTLEGRLCQQKRETACHFVSIVNNNRKIYSIPSSFSPLYSIWDPSLENGVTNIQGESSILSDPSLETPSQTSPEGFLSPTYF